jgi:hypothetical protein
MEQEWLNKLWRCTVKGYALDLVNHTFTLNEACLEHGTAYGCKVEKIQVPSLSLSTDASHIGRAYLTEPWSYIQLTSIEANRTSLNGQEVWKIQAELWQSKLEVICAELKIVSLPERRPKGDMSAPGRRTRAR